MKLKHVFYVPALLSLLTGLGFIIAPAVMWGLWGNPSDGAVMNLAGQNTGDLLLLSGMVAFYAARTDDSPLRRNICLSYFITHVAGFVIHVIPVLTGGPAFGPAWIFSLILGLAFGYFRFLRPMDN